MSIKSLLFRMRLKGATEVSVFVEPEGEHGDCVQLVLDEGTDSPAVTARLQVREARLLGDELLRYAQRTEDRKAAKLAAARMRARERPE